MRHVGPDARPSSVLARGARVATSPVVGGSGSWADTLVGAGTGVGLCWLPTQVRGLPGGLPLARARDLPDVRHSRAADLPGVGTGAVTLAWSGVRLLIWRLTAGERYFSCICEIVRCILVTMGLIFSCVREIVKCILVTVRLMFSSDGKL